MTRRKRARDSTQSLVRGIKDITTRLPGWPPTLLWRPRLPDVTELAPGWRRHDATHLEISLGYPATDSGSWAWDCWVLLPDSFRLGTDTYSHDQIGADLQSYFRFSPPLLALDDVPAAVGELVLSLDGQPGDAVDELKMFGSRLRESIARNGLDVRLAVREDVRSADDEVMRLTEAIDVALVSVRAQLVPEAAERSSDLGETARLVDEHISKCCEAAMIKISQDLLRVKHDGPALKRAREAAGTEARYRASLAVAPVASATSSTDELEHVERRQHALKRMTSSVLWLQAIARDPRRRAEHMLHSVAAGLAMSFALVAALLYGTPNDATDLWVWAGFAVLAYMAKDRIKAALQDAFNRRISRRYPNRNWIISERTRGLELARAAEKFGFMSVDELPPDVARLRRSLYLDSFGEVIESHAVLHHSKVTSIDSAVVRSVDPRVVEVTEILRLDVSRWLAHTDDPFRKVTLADPLSGELFESTLPRAYDVVVLHRLEHQGQSAEFTAARVIVSRDGIRRVDQLVTD